MKAIEISLLGPFRVARDGNPATAFATDAARALLAYLAMHAGLPCRREALAGLLWPDQPEATARHALAQTLSRVRQALGEGSRVDTQIHPNRVDTQVQPHWVDTQVHPYLIVSREALQFNPQADCWLDVAAFAQAIEACKRHPHRHLETCRSCMTRLREAAELYRGELMSGFSLPSVPFEQWLLAERERLHVEALDALRALAAYHERRGEHEHVLRYARRQLELEPWHEGAHRQCMRALALSGQRAAALAQYEACRRVLAEELDAEPEVETTALYERIRDAADLSGFPNLTGLIASGPECPYVQVAIPGWHALLNDGQPDLWGNVQLP
jgi:DNA-binding SARP family transcriptional activator